MQRLLNRRRLVWLLVLLLITWLGIFVTPTSRCIIQGWLRNESFYRGRPTTYWHEALLREGEKLAGQPKWYDHLLSRLGFPRPARHESFVPGNASAVDLGGSAGHVGLGGIAERMLGGDPNAIPVLGELLKEQDDRLRYAACRTLTRPGLPAQKIIPPLVEALSDSNVDIRLLATNKLGELGPEAKSAVPGLIHLIKDRPQDGRLLSHDAACAVRAAAIALGKIDPEAARQADMD
jgi:HEAT repeats